MVYKEVIMTIISIIIFLQKGTIHVDDVLLTGNDTSKLFKIEEEFRTLV